MYKVFYNLHIMCMCIWTCPAIAALAGQAFGSCLKITLSPERQLEHSAVVEAIPHHQTHIRWFTTFICCGCAYIYPYQVTAALSPSEGKSEHCVAVEATNPLKWVPTAMLHTYEVFHNLLMLWMCICICSNNVTTALVGQAYGSCLEFSLPPPWWQTRA